MKSALAVILLFAACAAAQASNPTKLTAAEKIGISGTRSVRDDMSDPESFRVSSVRIVDHFNNVALVGEHLAVIGKDETMAVVCIEGRSKNAMGGYVSLVGIAVGWMEKGFAVSMQSGSAGTTEAEMIGLICPADQGVDVTDVVKAALKTDREKE